MYDIETHTRNSRVLIQAVTLLRILGETLEKGASLALVFASTWYSLH